MDGSPVAMPMRHTIALVASDPGTFSRGEWSIVVGVTGFKEYSFYCLIVELDESHNCSLLCVLELKRNDDIWHCFLHLNVFNEVKNFAFFSEKL